MDLVPDRIEAPDLPGNLQHAGEIKKVQMQVRIPHPEMKCVSAGAPTEVEQCSAVGGIEEVGQLLSAERRVIVHGKYVLPGLLFVTAEIIGGVDGGGRRQDGFIEPLQGETERIQVADPVSQVIFAGRRQEHGPAGGGNTENYL